MYEELVKLMRYCANDNPICEKTEICPFYNKAEEDNGFYFCVERMLAQAADAIEELQAKWIKFETRELDPEEKEEHPDWCYIMACQLPDDGQEILVSNGRWVWTDTFCNDTDGCYLDGDGDLEGLWWMPLPSPPDHIREAAQMVEPQREDKHEV